MDRYEHGKIEKKWQQKWEENSAYVTKDSVQGQENFYQLFEFPYPSGNLHVGHWYAFAIPDIVARYKRMQGYNVLYPIGFDAFGLPAENAAIKRGVNPREWTYDNMDHMRSQMRSMGASFDWSREVVTCDPAYYKWTQWLFLQLYKNDLATHAQVSANWCPSCKTVLANEQVVDSKCERCESAVEKKQMQQWQIGITKYADRLIDDLDELDWPQEIKTSQKNWIGRSDGAELEFQIADADYRLKVFTTRPDTLYGVTYMVVAPEHRIIEDLESRISNLEEVQAYVETAAVKSEIDRTNDTKEKTGVKLEGIAAINPASGQEIPVYVADYVLGGYGTGAIMAVPAHDERDFAFAKKYDLTLIPVIDNGFDGSEATTIHSSIIHSEEFDGMDSEEAKSAIVKKVGGKMTKTYKLKDWTVSRQRYWGAPIPIIHCESCGPQAVPENQLPVVLPDVEDYLPNDEGRSPLSKVASFVNVSCPKCTEDAKRETDTFDTFMCSSWYFLRYCDSQNADAFADLEKLSSWMPVNHYSGGAEHTTMHLLYSRFFTKALADLKLLPDTVKNGEPYTRRMNRSLILGPDGNKMSKSKGNVIDPDDIVKHLGGDTMRLYLAFIGPYNEVGAYPWNPESIIGVRRFVERVWRLQDKVSTTVSVDDSVEREVHSALKRLTESIETYKLNTGVAAMMQLLNVFDKQEHIDKDHLKIFLSMLTPYAPHLCCEMWEVQGFDGDATNQQWPEVEHAKLVAKEMTLIVQVNGKVKDKITLPSDLDDAALERAARSSTKVQKFVDGKEIHKVIVVKGKLVNIVV